MRSFLVLLVVAGLGGLFYYQKHPATPASPGNPQPLKATTHVVQTRPAPRQPSEHDWMKRSLDRASEVAHQSRAQTQQAQDP